MANLGEPQPARLTLCVIGYATSNHVAARAKCFADRGHRVVLLSDARSEAEIPGVEQVVPGENLSAPLKIIITVANRLLGRRGDHLWRAIFFLSVLIRLRPDIVHVHFAYTYYGWLAGIFGCRPLVVTVMGGDVLFDEQGAPTETGKWLTGTLLHRADLITSKSHFLTATMERLWGIGHKCMRILWGIPVEHFKQTDATALAESLGVVGRTVLLSPRILRPLYQIHLIVEAMPAVLATHPDAVLLITEYGADPDYRAAIQNRVAELGIEHAVVFCGSIRHTDMPYYYSLSTLSVAVPSSDGLPQSLFEGMACGTPNILSRLPRYEEFITDGKSAWMVEQDPQAIAESIRYLLDHRELRESIAVNARALVETEGNFPIQVDRVEAAYFELAKTVRKRSFDFRHMVSTAFAYRRYRKRRG